MRSLAVPAIIALVLLLNYVATRVILFDGGATGVQKVMQLALAWLVPFVGAGFVISFIGSHHSRTKLKAVVPFPFYLVGYKEGATFKANPNNEAGERHYSEWRD